MEHSGAAPLDTLPAGLRRLQELGFSLACPLPSHERHLRVIVTVPTLRMAGVAAAFGAALADVACRDCDHQNLIVGKRVAGFVSGKFVDGTLSDIDVGGLRFAGITLTENRDSVHNLPAASRNVATPHCLMSCAQSSRPRWGARRALSGIVSPLDALTR